MTQSSKLFGLLLSCTSLRFDAAGFALPFAVGHPINQIAYTLPTAILRGLDRRVSFEDTLSAMKVEGGDSYAARSALYPQQRQAEIDALRGKVAG